MSLALAELSVFNVLGKICLRPDRPLGEDKDLDWSAAYVSTTPQTGKPALDLFVIGVLCLESVEHLPTEICDNPVELISSLN